jgi:aminodeoxyfutalosine deaminase
MHQQDQLMLEQGIVAVGDISNNSDSFSVKANSEIYYHTFIEQIGFVPGREDKIVEQGIELRTVAKDMGLSASVSPHAPYSVSKNLFRAIALLNEPVYTMHHLESAQEILFFEQKIGDFVRLYNSFEIDISFLECTAGNTTPYWLDEFRVKKLILVHNTFMKLSIDMIKYIIPDVYLCFCPNANLYIENTLPPILELMDETESICIGTDSLASNHQLSILEELKTIHRHFPSIPISTLMTWATLNGAKALGIDDRYGKFIKGKTKKVFALMNVEEFLKAEVVRC